MNAPPEKQRAKSTSKLLSLSRKKTLAKKILLGQSMHQVKQSIARKTFMLTKSKTSAFGLPTYHEKPEPERTAYSKAFVNEFDEKVTSLFAEHVDY